MLSLTLMTGSRKGGVLNLTVEVKVSRQSLLISRIMLIIDLEVLACFFFFFFFFFMVVKLVINLSTLNYSRLLVLDSFSPAQ